MKKYDMEVEKDGKVYKGKIEEDKVLEFLSKSKEEKVQELKKQNESKLEVSEERKIREIITRDGETYDTGWVDIKDDEERYKEIKKNFTEYAHRFDVWIENYRKDFDTHFEDLNKVFLENFDYLRGLPLVSKKEDKK